MKRRAAILAPAVLMLLPATAQAHLTVTGMGPLSDGVAHFALSPEDSLPVVGLGLLAGLRGPPTARAWLAALTLGWAAGGAAALAGLAPPSIVASAATALLYLTIGGLLAANRAIGPTWGGVLALLLGFIRGAADLLGVAPALSHAISLAGMAASAFVVFALATSITLPLRRAWMIVAARVGGSWLAALGLLFAGWLIRFGTAVQ
jgi:hypothetical protein